MNEEAGKKGDESEKGKRGSARTRVLAVVVPQYLGLGPGPVYTASSAVLAAGGDAKVPVL